MVRTKFAIDLDGVLFDFNTGWAELAQEMFGATVPAVPTSWNHAHTVLTKEQRNKMWQTIIHGHFWRDLPTYPRTGEFLKNLNQFVQEDEERQVYFVTSRSGVFVRTDSRAALNAAGFPNAMVIPVSNASKKLPILKALEIQLFVDDKPETVNETHRSLRKMLTVGFNQPWNIGQFSRGMKQIDTLSELWELIRGE